MKLGKAIHKAPMLRTEPGKGFVSYIDRRHVRIMAIAENYAMVRRRGCMPYVCAVKELEQSETQPRLT